MINAINPVIIKSLIFLITLRKSFIYTYVKQLSLYMYVLYTYMNRLLLYKETLDYKIKRRERYIIFKYLVLPKNKL